MTAFAVGSLVQARGREWLVLQHEDEALWVRPLAGDESECTWLVPALERVPVATAQFPPPDLDAMTNPQGARLLADSLRLSLRRGAGPFRSLGHLAVQPRPYQLVPLLMALRQDPIRLLIADDVGIGKTIEAGLIARELLDRGEITRIAVLCPPHLVSQWCDELRLKFNVHAQAVTATTAARLERGIPHGGSLFDQYPYTVVSLDYIKSDRRRDDFARACPDFVIVDEAHTCTQLATGKQLRYELLRRLADNPDRHLVLLSATPHSGNEAAFYKLLGLLDGSFEALQSATDEQRERLRSQLARHFVQRRRPDIEAWASERDFPDRLSAEATYRFSATEQKFFEDVLAWCRRVTEAAGTDERRRRLSFWGTLALMRCVGSSPAAAVSALSASLTDAIEIEDGAIDELQALATDGSGLEMPDSDADAASLPPANSADGSRRHLLAQAKALRDAPDSKADLLQAQLEALFAAEEPARPVVFCRYVATAHYLRERLAKACKTWNVVCDVVTGEIPDEERRAHVAALAEHERHLLIATDCLSEGINLQAAFDTVVHYDLSWNPTRHEQREGRVDRFGQTRKQVRALTIYGENNPIDGAVLNVILRKAEAIKRDLGVSVPMPDDGARLTEALMSALLLRQGPQLQMDLLGSPELRAADAAWQSARDRAKRTQTIFAQRGMRPDEVLPEWERQQQLLGTAESLRRFCKEALERLNAPLMPAKQGFVANFAPLPAPLRSRLDEAGVSHGLRVDFSFPPATGCEYLHRSHPLPVALAEYLLGQALGERTRGTVGTDAAVVARAGAWVTAGVPEPTWVALLRLRHRLVQGPYETLVEEAVLTGWQGMARETVLSSAAARAAIDAPPTADLQPVVRSRRLADLLQSLQSDSGSLLASLAQARANDLRDDHERVRQATGRRFAARPRVQVHALLPVDIVAVFFLQPAVG
jgi:superfamily II DNA or RNA helicase